MRTASRILWYNVNFKGPHTGRIEVYAEELSKRDAESDVRDIKSHGGDAWVVPVTSQDQFNKANSALGYRNANLKGEMIMRRTASSVLRELEIRIARLEKQSSRRWPNLGDTMGQKIEKKIDRKYPNQKPWRDQEPISESRNSYNKFQKNGFRMVEIDSPHTNGYYAIIRGDELISVHQFYDEAVRTFDSEARSPLNPARPKYKNRGRSRDTRNILTGLV